MLRNDSCEHIKFVDASNRLSKVLLIQIYLLTFLNEFRFGVILEYNLKYIFWYLRVGQSVINGGKIKLNLNFVVMFYI